MSFKTFSIGCLIFLFTLLSCGKSLDYDDLIETGKYCPSRDKCDGYRNRLTYMDRNCECDTKCASYRDCCIDAGGPRRRPTGTQTRKPEIKRDICLPYSNKKYAGVYVVTECSRDWTGSDQVRAKCTGPLDLYDLMNATPVTSVQGKTSYRNMFCAQCNNANMNSLKLHEIQLGCADLEGLTQEQIADDLTYNDATGTWGIYRPNSDENEFIGCKIDFNVPDSLNSSVRFCRPNVVSTCASDWTGSRIKRNCQEYMAVVYDDQNVPYRNPHCALCNHKTADGIFCYPSDLGKIRPFSPTSLLKPDEQPTRPPQCPSNQIYDPFFKRCKRIICALSGYRAVKGRCVRG